MAKRSPGEIAGMFAIQRYAMEKSCAAYDSGEIWEALRLATSIYTLVHDRGRNRSILTQLGIKDSLRFVTSVAPIEIDLFRKLSLWTPLVERFHFENEGFSEMIPLSTWFKFKDKASPFLEISFSDWWENQLIFKGGNAVLTRQQLVSTLRDQEGGSHYDEKLSSPHYSRAKFVILFMRPDGSNNFSRGIELAMMRQIAWELTQTLALIPSQNIYAQPQGRE